MKNVNLDNLNEEELAEYLAQNQEEDQTADLDGGTIPEEKDSDGVTIAAEIEMPAPKKRIRLATAEEKAKKKAEKERLKQIKKHRKYLKKHPSTLVRYDIDPQIGLTDEIAEQRMIDELTNCTSTKSNRPIPKIIFKNIFTFFNVLIFIIGGCLIAVGAPITDFVFLLIVSCNIIIGIIQEINAKNMIDKLSLMSSPTAFVRRSGIEHEIAVTDVVLDDCLLLENGRQICADSIIIEGTIEVNESLLTGESDAILKKPGDILYSGSYVVSGKCCARVDKVGKDNYIEKLSSQAKQYKAPKSDLYSSLKTIIKVMAFPVVIIGGFLFAIMFFKNNVEISVSVRKTAGAMIGMIPSGLFLMSTIALYVGVIRLGQKNVLVQDLYCIEMLARVDCICLDKTGTITDGTMVVKNVIDYNNVHGLATRNIVSAMLNALQDNNLTSQALKDKFGLGKRIRHTATIPFSSSRKFQAVTFDKYGTFILGAPEFVLKSDFKRVEKDVNKYASLGYRVLCLAHKEGTITGVELPEGPIEIMAMILIEDNIRPDAINTIKYFRESGVEVRVISGDNPITVSKIAERAGVSKAEKYVSLDGKSDSDVINEVRKGTTVFGRVSPEQKKLIIKTLKELGKTVAMTGDGVNDILALKEADCSIAVASGSQAVRSCSHLVLLDSNFDSMPSVVSEGRRVINNVSKVAALFLTKTIFSLFLAIEALITGNYPIATSQLIIIEAFAIGVPSLILVNEPNNRPVKGKFLTNVIREALPGALVILVISIVVFSLSTELNLDNITLTTVIVIAATHTCMMVLFKVCRPFNTIHKALCTFCYSMFILIVVLMPQFLELRPVFTLTEYYSDSVNLQYLSSYPRIDRSASNHYVIDGVYSDILTPNSTAKGALTASEKDGVIYYYIDGVETSITNELPKLSYADDGTIYVGGYKISNGILYEDNLKSKLRVDEKGLLFCGDNPVKITLTKSNEKYNYTVKYGNYNASTAVFQYNVLPTVTIKDGEYIIEGNTQSDVKYLRSEKDSIEDKFEVTINPSTMELLINGSPVYGTNTITDEVSKESYKVSMPKFTTTGIGSTMYIDAINTKLTVYELFGDTTYAITDLASTETAYTLYDADNKAYTYVPATEKSAARYYTDGVASAALTFTGIGNGFATYTVDKTSPVLVNKLALTFAKSEDSVFSIANDGVVFPKATAAKVDNTMYSPDVTISTAGKYIIDGYYTEFDFSSVDLNPHLDNNNNLVIGNKVTDYQVKSTYVITQTGGMVTQLTTTGKIFLLMLCLVAGPLMRLLQNLIPWIITQGRTVRKLLGKIQ